MSSPDEGDFRSYSRLILSDLKRLGGQLDSFQKELETIKVEIGVLKVKAGIWGLMGGLIPAVAALLMMAAQKMAGAD